MNFPVGAVSFKGSLPVFFEDLAGQLSNKNFNGYVIQTVRGSVIEEGVLFFRDGVLNACCVECLATNQFVKGIEAIPLFFNQTKGKGFFQVVELTRSQVDLVTAFDSKLLLTSKIDLKDIAKLIPVTFRANFLLPTEKGFSLADYGLDDLKNNE